MGVSNEHVGSGGSVYVSQIEIEMKEVRRIVVKASGLRRRESVIYRSVAGKAPEQPGMKISRRVAQISI